MNAHAVALKELMETNVKQIRLALANKLWQKEWVIIKHVNTALKQFDETTNYILRTMCVNFSFAFQDSFWGEHSLFHVQFGVAANLIVGVVFANGLYYIA